MTQLLIVDPYVNSGSPTMRGIVASLDVLVELFDRIEVWATECDWSHPKVSLRRVPRPLKPWALHAHYYAHTVNRWARELPADPKRLVQVSGCLLPCADIRYIQFWNQLWIEESRKRPQISLTMLSGLQSRIAARAEAEVLRNAGSTGEWWVVSRALADRIQALGGGGGTFSILPNQYDPERFNRSVRDEWRESMRGHYGFQPHERVLVFSAFGHFERKGLRQAVEAVELLRQRGHPLRFLILGGSPETLRRFRKTLSPAQQEGCIFAGLVDHIERHLAAADGLLFPSHFEAFSLAEIEAAALGLRLYLTPHYGSEMILREPSNGRLLPWDPAGMAAVIARDLADGTLGQAHHELGEAITRQHYGERLRSLYQDAIRRKHAGQFPI